MATNELETEVGSEDLTSLDAASLTHELSSSSSSSWYQEQDIKARDAKTGPRRRLKKLRSNKAVRRLPSLKIAEGTFPNYMKTTSSSTAKETLQRKSATSLTKLSSFKPGRSLIRMSSARSRRTLTRRSSAGAEIKRKLNKSLSIKPGRVDFAESTLSDSQDDRQLSSGSVKNAASTSNQSMEFKTRASTLRPLRRLTKVASLRTRRPSLKKTSQLLDLHAEKATCSSAVKESKFSDHLDLEHGGTRAQGIASVKVCPYSYCSLHGHDHASPSPLKGFVLMRRHKLNAPKSTESQSRSPDVLKHSSDGGRTRASRMNLNRENADTKVANPTKENCFVERIVKQEIYTTESDLQNGTRDSSGAAEETRGKHDEIRREEVTGVGFHQKTVQINSTIYMGNSAPNISEDNASTDVADNTVDDVKCPKINASVEKRSISDVNPELATLTEELAESEAMNEDSVQDISNATANVIPDQIHDVTHEPPKVKHMKMWNLIYKQMVSGLAAEDKIQTDEKAEETNQHERVNAFPGISYFKENQIGDCDGEIQNILLYQNNAIKIVQEAFDKILSEIPDQSSDDKSLEREAVSDKEGEDINAFKGTRLSISNFSYSLKDNLENHPDGLGMTVDSSKCLNEERAEPNEERKLEKKDFKSWSNVKKILMLNRFVKALEKVKNINPRKPKILPVQPHSEAEKVNLRHLTMGGRKQSEEWMLDYALQKVIFTLAPAQKRKVAVLVQAFQTIIPEISTPLTPNSDIISSTTAPVDSCTNSPDQLTSEKEKEAYFGTHLRKTEIGDDSSKREEKFIYSYAAEDHKLNAFSESQETRSKCCFSMEKGACIHKIASRDPRSSTNHKTKENQHGAETSIQELAETRSIDTPSRDHEVEPSLPDVPKEVCPEPASEAQDLDSESNNQKLEGDNQIETFEQSCGPKTICPEPLLEHGNVAPSVEPPETSCEASEAEVQLKGKFLQLFSSLDDSQPNSARGVAQEFQLEKQLNTKLWYLIYKHMVSGSTTKLDGEDQERGDGANASTNALAQQGSSEMKNNAIVNHEETDDLEQIEAIRLVEEAIDDIPFPETQEDLRDDPPLSPENKHLIITEELGEVGNISTLIETNCSRKEPRERSAIAEEEQGNEAKNMNTDKEVKREPSIGNKLKAGTQKRWSNVKKLILLQRFMKSMEKVKKINPDPRRFIPLDPAVVAEKVNLRHQGIGNRKSSDEWMLDYTLQRVVSKLTPARKRKVQLLVEAFETVIPPNWT